MASSRVCFVAILVAICGAPAMAQVPEQIARDLKAKLQGRIFMIRNFYSNAKLTYDLNGVLQSKSEFPSWRVAGMRVDDLEMKSDQLDLTGKRVVTISAWKRRKAETFVSDDQIELQVLFAGASPDEATLAHALNKVFLTNDDDVANLEKQADQNNVPSKIGGDVKPPHAVHTPDPEYSPEARQSKLQGTVLLWIVVGADGTVHDVRVLRRLGQGLDEQAVRAVRSWRFTPATKNGKPVSVMMNVEVNFRLYN